LQYSQIRAYVGFQNGLERSAPTVVDSGRSGPAPVAIDFSFPIDSVEQQRRYIELHTKIASQLTADELAVRIAAAEKEIGENDAAAKLQVIHQSLVEIQEQHPNSEAAKSAQRALDAIKRGDSTLR
jgi:hypothetical protein